MVNWFTLRQCGHLVKSWWWCGARNSWAHCPQRLRFWLASAPLGPGGRQLLRVHWLIEHLTVIDEFIKHLPPQAVGRRTTAAGLVKGFSKRRSQP